MASWTNLPQFQSTCSTSIFRMDQILDNITVLSTHGHTGADGDGASAISIDILCTNPTYSVPGYEQPIFPFLPASFGNWNRVVACPGYKNGGILKTNQGVSASGACISYSVLLHQRTGLRPFLVGYGDSNSGCIAACIGGSQLLIGGASTQSLYSATPTEVDITYDSLGSLAPSGIAQLRIQVVGKDGSSSGYHAGLTHIVIGFA